MMTRIGMLASLLLAAGLSACDGGGPLPPSPGDAMSAEGTAPTPVIDPSWCAIPDGYTLVVKQCSPTSVLSTCIAQNYPFAVVPAEDLPNVTQVPIADCAVSGRADLHCVAACP